MPSLSVILSSFLLCMAANAEMPLSFTRDIQPILSNSCYTCHGPDERARKAKLRLDVESEARKALGTSSADSEVYARIIHADPAERMPPADSGKTLSDAQIAKLKQWLDEGAKYEQHWAFVKPARAEVPAVSQIAWPKNGIDNFILARLEQEGIAPSPEADKITVLRRVHLDLTGLPPTPAEVDAFNADDAPDAFERAVDRLLASPHFGERWGRHWLDGARYADSNGYSIDSARDIWPYRDWIINAFNSNMPFDEFIIEQYAGDLLPGATRQQRTATGFHRNTMINEEGGVDPEEFRIESIIDRVNTTGTLLLGLTLGCARCHTHKYDPITQEEYYRLFAFLNNDDEPTMELPAPEQEAEVERAKARIAAATRRVAEYIEGPGKEKLAAWEAKQNAAPPTTVSYELRAILGTPPEARSEAQRERLLAAYRPTDEELRRLEAEKERQERKMPRVPTTMVLAARAARRETHVLAAGDFTRPTQVVTPGVPAALNPLAENTGSRLDLARWLVSKDNPLTARVAVNRMWMHLFGKGLVETDDDFGMQGTPPSHPELLDWLAVEFMESGWDVKHMLRLMVTSATYRQASISRPELNEVDPRNVLLARQNRIRLDAEIIRDSALAAAGVLNEAVGGPGVFPPQPDGVMRLGQKERPWKTSEDADRYRRGLYTFFWRATPHPALTVFDAPDAQTACTRRNRSTTPLQSLTLLNDRAYVVLAQALGKRVQMESAGDNGKGIDELFRVCLGRAPEEEERQVIARLLQQEGGDWTAVSRAMLNLDEFITRE